MPERRKVQCRSYGPAVLGWIFGTFAITFSMFWNQIFYKFLDMQLALSPNVVYYAYWKNPSDPVHMNVYFFNWTNPEDFSNLSIKPIVQQCGPYSFIEKPSKIDIKWHSANDSVSYRKQNFYYFDAERSNGTLEDKIIALNAVAMTAAIKTKDMNAAQRGVVTMGLNMLEHQRHVIRTVDELFISGYSDSVISLARNIPIFGTHKNVPDKFGWFYGNNGSSDVFGSFNVHAGATNASRRGQIHTWNSAKHTGFFKPDCDFVHGSVGEFHTPNLTPESVIYIFSPELCRSVPLEYTETVDFEGIKGYKFSGGLRYIDNGTIYPENKCFCKGKCYPSGVTDVSSCRLDAPIYVSLPHFYQADPYYANLVEGMQPNRNHHEMYVIVEPKTGATMEVAARLQVNMLVEPVPDVRLFKNVRRVFFPLIWMESKFKIGPEKVSEIKMMFCVLWTGYAAAVVLLLIGIFLLCWPWLRSRGIGCGNANSPRPEYKATPLVPIQRRKSLSAADESSTGYTFISGNDKNT